MPEDNQRTERIRKLNDHFRFLMLGGEIYFTQEISALEPQAQRTVMEKVRLFDAFDKANDPYGEHDFGAIMHEGEHVYFKIDYYNKDKTAGSENPADPKVTTRVMTVMFAHEY